MSLQGERDLGTLLASLDPILDPETFIFLTTKEPMHNLPLQSLQPQMLFQESESLTIIVSSRNLDGALDFARQATFKCRMISLRVHSSLEAVGLIAAIAAKLKERGISSNVVSGFFHDHLFVPLGREDDTMQALRDLAREAGSS
ncbi:conserved hypothetical protein [Histoplasma capsulatum G186AR]|uniref:DUF2241 domain-containing protein n=1 Tax=Ajellomyces capsulatus (strain G186AR / H82 / ATCC MYA-2454 / RMSCC 2432) TaxID=447093 RepID=C0NLE0_AJECG|nr:uncharacterized protein HCBG_04320 [Histoplasma capsulatum G186AR]EEH07441.1 conserved hypothetical protein [Histoplasma capsulatum G186AR]